MTKNNRMRALLFVSASLLAAPVVGHAQSSPSSSKPAAAASASAPAAIGEVVVTAERREQNAQKASLTLQVLGSDAIQKAGITTAMDLQKLTTGLQIGLGGPNAQIFIRGVGSFAYTPLDSPGVAFNVDGVYVGRPDAIGSNFYDIARVEVLKGPQGTLYGRNANGGAINVITNEAQPGRNYGFLDAEVGNYDLAHLAGAANISLNDKAALRLAFNVVNRSGYLSDGTNDDVEQAARLRFKWIPSDTVTVRLNADYSHLGGKGGGYTYLPQRPGSDPWEAESSAAANAYRASFLPLGPRVNNALDNSTQDSTFYNFSAQVDWNLGFATLTILPAYRHAETYSLAYPSALILNDTNDRQKTLEARLANSDGRLQWVAGAYYFDEAGNGVVHFDQSDALQNYLQTYVPHTTSYAAFGQATLKVTDTFRLIGGLRYTYDKNRLSGRIDNLATHPLSLIEAFGGETHSDGVTYKVGAEYDVTPTSMLYATYSTGFKAGGLAKTVAPANIYQPEHLDAFEVGSKNRFFGNRLQVNASGYYWKYKDLQDNRAGFDPLGKINFLTFNSGDATIYGGTVDIIARLTDADTVSFSGEYAHSRYDSYFFQNPAAVFNALSTGCRVTGPYPVGATLPYTDGNGHSTNVSPSPVMVGNCSGNQVARVPEWTGTVTYQHVFELPNSANITLDGSVKFATAQWLNVDFIAAERQKAYSVVDANLTYNFPNHRTSVGLFVRNLTNEAYYTGGIEQAFVASLFSANIAPPRTYGIRAHMDFN